MTLVSKFLLSFSLSFISIARHISASSVASGALSASCRRLGRVRIDSDKENRKVCKSEKSHFLILDYNASLMADNLDDAYLGSSGSFGGGVGALCGSGISKMLSFSPPSSTTGVSTLATSPGSSSNTEGEGSLGRY